MQKAEDFHRIRYNFHFLEQPEWEDLSFTVLLDRVTGTAKSPAECRGQRWTRLGFNRCSICPLSEEAVSHCPIAYNISGLIERFNGVFSIESCEITVEVSQRTYLKRTHASEGLGSLLGIYMATSGCPHMAPLKPMARFHLPFASLEETIYRQAGNLLLSEYFRQKADSRVGLDVQQLVEVNTCIDQVNLGICRRVEHVVETDVSRNALAVLNVFGLMLRQQLQDHLGSLSYLYQDLSPAADN